MGCERDQGGQVRNETDVIDCFLISIFFVLPVPAPGFYSHIVSFQGNRVNGTGRCRLAGLWLPPNQVHIAGAKPAGQPGLCAFFELLSERRRFPVSRPFSPRQSLFGAYSGPPGDRVQLEETSFGIIIL